MFCEKCGGEAPDSGKTCPDCGANLYPPPLPGMENAPLPLSPAPPVQTTGFASSRNGSAGSGRETARPYPESSRQGQAGYAGQGGFSAPPPYAANPYGGSPYGPPAVPCHDPGVEPLTVWGFMWTMLIGSIPIIGWIVCLIWAFGGSRNLNRRNYAMACLLWLIIGIVLAFCAFVVLGLFGAFLSSIQSI